MEDKTQIIAALDDIRVKNKLVVVEGIKDKAALSRLEITNVFAINRTPMYKVVEHVALAAKEVVLLVDLDDEGRKLYHLLAQDLQRHKVKIDNTLRDLLSKTSLRHIEGLDSFLERAEIKEKEEIKKKKN